MSEPKSSCRRGTDLVDQIIEDSWEYSDADTQYLTHNVHRYSGKFIPQIAGRAIDLLTKPGDLVLDPFCGSGTTLLESAIRGRNSIGYDLNPLAVLITQVKITPVESRQLQYLRERMRKVVAAISSHSDLPLFSDPAPVSEIQERGIGFGEWFTKWFQPHVLVDLRGLHSAIEALESVELRRIALVAFSNILRKCSNAHSGYPNVMFDKKAPLKRSPLPAFLKSLNETIEAVSSINGVLPNQVEARVERGNSEELKLVDASIDAVVTHPPYIGSVPYAEYGALSLMWLGSDPKALDAALTGGKRQSKDVVRNFENSYRKIIGECHRVLKHDHYAFFMVGNPTVKGEMVDLREMTIRLANEHSFKLVGETLRHGSNRRANRMDVEFLLFFQK